MEIKKLNQPIMIAAIVIIAAAIGLATTTLFSMAPDNAVEEACEEVIELETGIEVDLTPSSVESKKK
jgi:hypothetical protein